MMGLARLWGTGVYKQRIHSTTRRFQQRHLTKPPLLHHYITRQPRNTLLDNTRNRAVDEAQRFTFGEYFPASAYHLRKSSRPYERSGLANMCLLWESPYIKGNDFPVSRRPTAVCRNNTKTSWALVAFYYPSWPNRRIRASLNIAKLKASFCNCSVE